VKVFPTLNIASGRVVSALGDAVPDADPFEIVDRLLDRRISHLALVDVDAAGGRGNNRELMGRILRRTRVLYHGLCVQVAGGIRSSDQAQYFLDHGAAWLVVGTLMHKSPVAVEQLLARFQKHLTAAIDARSGAVHHSGWAETIDIPIEQLAQRVHANGFRRVLFVDLPQGPDSPPDFVTARKILAATHLPLLMGGSIRSAAHLKEAKEMQGLQGALVDALLIARDPAMVAFLPSSCA
jgi:phosphoribosylformimino-5-aminoimidazole carboxamide ribonucleotide (ProFAR) isomerase